MRRPAFAIALVALGCSAVAAQSIDTVAIHRQFARFATDSTPGCAIAMARGGMTVFEAGYGLADLEHSVPITPGTVFEAGSVSKQFTAAAVITLAERGKLSLDDDIRKWFPELHDFGTTITVRHLLQHTSGLRDWGAIVELEGWPRGTRTIDHRYVLAVIARQRALNHPPGAAYSYTNSGYSLLAMLVERASGESLARFTQREFFLSLGMTRTTWRDDFARTVRGRAQAYASTAAGWRLDMPFENPHGHGGLLTTAGDLLRWNQALADRRVGTPRVAEVMEQTGVLVGGRPITYAGGLVVDSVRGVIEVGHSGSTAGYRAHLARYPAAGVSAVVLCNAGNASATGLLRQSVAGLAGLAPSVVTVGTNRFVDGNVAMPAKPTSGELRAFAGIWLSPEANARWTITVHGDTLRLARHEGESRVIRSAGRDRFTVGTMTLQFERDASGRTSRLLASIPRALNVPFARQPRMTD